MLAAGSTAAFIPASTRTSPISASPSITSGMAGASRGPTMSESCTTALPPVPTASPGASARSWCGGTRRSRSGRGWTVLTSTRRNVPITGRPKARREWTASRGDKPFVLHPDGVAWLYVTSGLKDGPLPTHFEPLESPFRQCAVSGSRHQSAGRQEGPPGQ